MVRHGTFVYTWDVVGDPAAAERIAGLGMDTATLQASYHAVRAITPRHPLHRIVHAEHAAAYFRLRPDRWRGRRLRPPSPGWGVAEQDRFGTAAAALAAAGLRVEAWLVLTHSSILGRAAPELTVRNAFGEPYSYALCPAHPEVREYALALVREVAEQYDVTSLMLEACGWLGYEHGSHHDKTHGADLSPGVRDLLSVCLCHACRAALGDRGLDPDDLARDLRTAVDAELRSGVPAGRALADTIGAPRARLVFAHRASVIAGLVRGAARAAPARELLLMAADNPQATGPDVGVDLEDFAAPADAFVLKCWGAEEPALSEVRGAAKRTRVPLIANVTVLEEQPVQLAARVRRLLAAGAHEFRYYHSGLASAARLAALRAAVHQEVA